jgi:hypothetical protein
MEDPPPQNIPTLDDEYDNIAKDINSAVLVDMLKIIRL